MANAPIINRPRFRISRFSFLNPPSQQNAAWGGKEIDLNANAIRQNSKHSNYQCIIIKHWWSDIIIK